MAVIIGFKPYLGLNPAGAGCRWRPASLAASECLASGAIHYERPGCGHSRTSLNWVRLWPSILLGRSNAGLATPIFTQGSGIGAAGMEPDDSRLQPQTRAELGELRETHGGGELIKPVQPQRSKKAARSKL